MCGIMGYSGKLPVVDVLIKGLKRLEYRGYDSAGVAYLENDQFTVRKSEGKIVNVEKLLAEGEGKNSHLGIGHTRWATHGKPTTQNAHPHQTEHVVLVHNGIIENYQEIRKDIQGRGYNPKSETDSELFGFLVLDEMKKGAKFVDAVRSSFSKLEGQCSVVIMSEKEPGTLIGVRNGSPLVVGRDSEGGVVLASDAQPILEYTQDVFFLESGDMVICKDGGLEFSDFQTGEKIDRKETHLDWSAEELDKQGFPHYMLKEIHEQPNTLIDTLNGVMDRANTDPFPLAAQPGVEILENADEITLIAAGTSWHAASVGKYWIEKWAGIPVNVELASEFRYRTPVFRGNAVVVGVSQSGETADTLAVIAEMKKLGVATIGLTNVRGSTITREADAAFFTSAGPEIGVAATKTFMAQLGVLISWAGYLGIKKKKLSSDEARKIFDQLIQLPHLLQRELETDGQLIASSKKIAKALQNKKGFFFIGRGYSYPLALEGALKLKEIAYVHAEGYAGGELKHGPIAMIDEGMVVVVLAPSDKWREKIVSNLQEVKARGAIILSIGSPSDEALREQSDYWMSMELPKNQGKGLDEALFPFLLAPAIQLLSYDIAVLKKTNVDQPRNLAKSVTVE